MWQNLVRRPFGDDAPESVHLADYPEPDPGAVDAFLSRRMAAVREIVSLGLQVRTANKLRVRQPLEAAELILADPSLAPALREHEALIRDELNVHAVHFVLRADDYVTYQVKPNFRALGPRAGKRMPKLKAALAEADGARLLRELDTSGRVRIEVDGELFELGPHEIAVSLEAREGFAAAAGGAGVVALRTTLTPELVEEGRFREVLNRVQSFRKELDLEYTGRIRLTLDGAGALLDSVRPRVDLLSRETLAVAVTLGAAPAGGAHVREVTIDGDPLTLGVEPV
jgi:isoleucyl-tRNA synthetase